MYLVLSTTSSSTGTTTTSSSTTRPTPSTITRYIKSLVIMVS